MKKIIDKLLKSKLFCEVICTLAVIVIYTIFAVLINPTFAYWANAVTDVVIGAVLGFIVYGTIDTIKTKQKVLLSWRFWFLKIIQLAAIGTLFMASRATTYAQLIWLIISCVTTTLFALMFDVFVYRVSIVPAEELLQRKWDYLVSKAKKMGKERFLQKEYEFRTCETMDSTIFSDLDFGNPFATIKAFNGQLVGLTYNKALELGMTQEAEIIKTKLMQELEKVTFV